MNITIPLKPIKITAVTKDAIINRIAYSFDVRGRAYVGNGSYCMILRDDSRLVYNLQKMRPKFKRTGKLIKVKGKDHRVKQSMKVRDGGWIAYVYIFKKDFPVDVNQGPRTFTVSVNKRKVSNYN